jgi:hypothetical protein
MTQEEIQSQVNAFMIGRLDYAPSMLTPEAELKRDLGMTSLDAVETAIFIKYSFGFLSLFGFCLSRYIKHKIIDGVTYFSAAISLVSFLSN